VRTEVSGDRKFITIVPLAPWAGEAGGQLSVAIDGSYLVNPTRKGPPVLRRHRGGAFSQHTTFTVRAIDADDTLPLPVPAAPGDPAGVWELYRIAAPLPTILPSYNQIGFDSLHYLIGLVEGDAPATRSRGSSAGSSPRARTRRSWIPRRACSSRSRSRTTAGALTLVGTGFAIEFNLIRLPFEFFRIATRVDGQGNAEGSPALNVSAVCGGITVYGQFLRQPRLLQPADGPADGVRRRRSSGRTWAACSRRPRASDGRLRHDGDGRHRDAHRLDVAAGHAEPVDPARRRRDRSARPARLRLRDDPDGQPERRRRDGRRSHSARRRPRRRFARI
jgi:hypothetical protein